MIWLALCSNPIPQSAAFLFGVSTLTSLGVQQLIKPRASTSSQFHSYHNPTGYFTSISRQRPTAVPSLDLAIPSSLRHRGCGFRAFTSSTRIRLSAKGEHDSRKPGSIPQPIIAYHLDEEGDWVAELQCGHNQHVRHNPPMTDRPWVLTEKGRNKFLGYPLPCKLCVTETAEKKVK